MTPLAHLTQTLQQNGLVKFLAHFVKEYPECHLKDLTMETMGPGRQVQIHGKTLINFGSDSFLGLDQDPRVQEALHEGIRKWGTHNGTSRAFASVEANIRAEEKLASWLGTEAVLIYPSVTLANLGAIPGLVGKPDLLVVDQHAHNSIQEGARIAKANGTRVLFFENCDPMGLSKTLEQAGKYRLAVVAIDGVYSMSGVIPPLKEINQVCLNRNAVLYVDDAHATAVLGTQGRGTVLDAVGNYDNTLVVGSLSKGFSCLGGFVGCTGEMKTLLKMRSNTYIFGGPVGPPYLEAICAVCDILTSGEYLLILENLRRNQRELVYGLKNLGLNVLGGETPIVSIVSGDETNTLKAGKMLFDQGYYVQSVIFPAVPYHSGVLRVQVNANHELAAVQGLVQAFAKVTRDIPFPDLEPARQAI